MGYYMGDYYGIASRRSFGDPGFLSFLKGVGRVVGGALGIGGGGGATKVIQIGAATGMPIVRGGARQVVSAGRAIVKRGVGIVKKHPVLSAAGAAGAIGAAAGGVGAELLEGGRARKRRRMNPYNPRALRRALRRTHSFAKMARKIVRVQKMYKKPRGRFAMGPYGKKKRRA